MTNFNMGGAHHDSLTRAHLSENQFGFSPKVWPSVERERARMHLYPDPDCRLLREALARFYDIGPDMIAVANGTDEVILTIALAFLEAGVSAVVSSGTFPGYATSSSIGRADILSLPLDSYRVPLDAMSEVCKRQRSVVFVCNPHNPTGTIADAVAIERLIRSAAETSSLLVFDEAYAEFAGRDFASVIPLIRGGARALVMRTFSKAYGLAGFRIGYVIGCPEDIERIRQVRSGLPFAVNRLAQVAALCALGDQPFLTEVVERTICTKAQFYSKMDSANISYMPSQTNFVLLDVGGDSDAFAARLLNEFGILSRDAGPFGLPSHVRVSMLGEDQLPNLCAALEHVHRSSSV